MSADRRLAELQAAVSTALRGMNTADATWAGLQSALVASYVDSPNMPALRGRAMDLRIVNYSMMDEAALREAIRQAENDLGLTS